MGCLIHCVFFIFEHGFAENFGWKKMVIKLNCCNAMHKLSGVQKFIQWMYHIIGTAGFLNLKIIWCLIISKLKKNWITALINPPIICSRPYCADNYTEKVALQCWLRWMIKSGSSCGNGSENELIFSIVQFLIVKPFGNWTVKSFIFVSKVQFS